MPEFRDVVESADLRADDLLDKPVFDLHGRMLGRVTLAREGREGLLPFDVLLTPRARDAFSSRGGVATVDPDHIVAADEEITLDEAAEWLLHPADAPPPSREGAP